MALSKRLCVAADFVRDGVFVVDVGTDHAHLPIELCRRGRVKGVLACDVAEGPLANAARSIEAAGLKGQIALRQSDGLLAVQPQEADDVIIAGMGGDLIARIIAAAPWLREGGRRLILQPVTSADDLRDRLCEMGYEILTERAVYDGGRLYTVMLVAYSGRTATFGRDYRYIGGVDLSTPEGRDYALRQVRRLRRHADSLSNAGTVHAEQSDLREIADIIEQKVQAHLK